MKDVFDGNSGRYDEWYERNRFAYLSEVQALKMVLPKKGKGLEIGVGTGRFAGPLGIGYGVDTSKNMLDLARKRGVNVKKAPGEKLPFRRKTFDYVAVIVALSFVRYPQKVLVEAARVLKPGGVIVIGMIDRDSFLGKYYISKKGIFYKKANLLEPYEVSELLTAAGFKKLSYSQTIFSLPGKMRSVHKVAKGCGKGGFVVIRGLKK